MTMQTPDKRMFIDMQEHPEKYSEEQIEAMMDILDQMPDVETAWQKFTEISRLGEWEISRLGDQTTKPPTHQTTRKVAAAVIGIVMAGGIALAAIHLVHSTGSPSPQDDKTEQIVPVKPSPSMPSVTAKTDSVETERIFDNVTLADMLAEIAEAHHVGIEFRNEEVRRLRFHFVWKRADGLERTVEKLNTFEPVDIVVENDKLIVR